MGVASFLSTIVLAIGVATAQFATYSNNNYGLSVNVPTDTASSKSGSIYMQITVPSGTTWAAFAQGSQMNGATMFVIYASGSTVVLSPRAGSGHNMPQYSSNIEAVLLDGSSVNSDGSIIANIRCDNCLSSMDPTSKSTKWIMAYKSGSALGSNSQSASIAQHDAHSSFTLDLTTGTGGSSTNPFVASSASSSSASASGSSTATNSATSASSSGSHTTSSSSSSTNSVIVPVASSNPNTGSTQSSSSSSGTSSSNSPSSSPYVHGILMSILFIGFFPLFALTLYLPTTKKVRFIHAPLQTLSVILLIVGLVLGIIYGKTINQLDGHHQIIGYIVIAAMVLVQPALGIYQHLHYHKTGGRSPAGPVHQWLGRGAIALGVINGGIGWQLTDSSDAYVPYAVCAVVVFLIYIAVVVFSFLRARRVAGYPANKGTVGGRGYEMHNSKEGRSNVNENEIRY